MAEDSRGGWNWRALLVVGCTVGVFLAVGFVRGEFFASLSSATADFFSASPENALRALQLVGILLPLFTGLLRFTTSSRSEVSEQVNDHLLLGIFGLVLAGVSAAIAGMSTTVTGILKLSLLFILLTFVVVGLAAVAMFGELTTETDGSENATKEPDTVDETHDDETKHIGLEDAEGDVSPKAGAESESESNEEVE